MRALVLEERSGEGPRKRRSAAYHSAEHYFALRTRHCNVSCSCARVPQMTRIVMEKRRIVPRHRLTNRLDACYFCTAICSGSKNVRAFWWPV